MDKNEYLTPKYPASFTNKKLIGRLYPHLKKWIKNQRTYQLHVPTRKRMPSYRKYRVPTFGYPFQADLCDMIKYKNKNKSYQYILTIIDIFSRYAWAIGIKDKTGKSILAAFKKIKYTPHYLQVDQGTEFYNKVFKSFLDSKKCKLFSVYSQHKAAVVERFNRTLKGKMFRYFTHRNTTKWIDVLEDLVQSYNNTPHSSLPKNLTPREAKEKFNWWLVWKSNNVNDKPSKTKLKIGDFVRISKVKGRFEKGYLPNWSEQIFRISRLDKRDKPTMFELVDYKDEEIKGKFYQQELQKVNPPEKYPIEKFFKRLNNKYLVKFLGYPEKYWVQNIENL